MKEIKLVLRNLPPQPRNDTHEKTKYGIKLSDMAVAFQEDIRERLASYGKRGFFSGCESITCSFIVYTPVAHFLTKDDRLSKTSIDLDAHKLFLDEIAKHFGFNDGLIWDFNPIKLPVEGDEWIFKLHITGEERTTWPVNTVTQILSSPGFQTLS